MQRLKSLSGDNSYGYSGSMGKRRKDKKKGLPPLPTSGFSIPDTLGLPPPPLPGMDLPPPPPIEDFTWSEKVVEKVMEDTGITDKEELLEVATKHDSDENKYLKESEIRDAATEISKSEESEYASLWERTSEKPLPQVYGHIDRLGTGEVGSLLDRYADRFGHSLDREIIVMRQKEQQQLLAAIKDAPTIELIDGDDGAEVEVTLELEQVQEKEEIKTDVQEEIELHPELNPEIEAQLEKKVSIIEKEIKSLEPKFKLAQQRKQKSKINKLGPKLMSLVEQRDLIFDVLDGVKSLDSLKTKKEDDADEPEGDFAKFVEVVDELLGKMPDEAVEKFVNSKEFDIYKNVASDPNGTSKQQREIFFKLVDKKLGQMPEAEIEDFVNSVNFQIYQETGVKYGM